MRLRIEDGDSLRNVQKQFNMAFPFLQLEFFKWLNGSRKPLQKEEVIRSSNSIAEPAKKSSEAIDITINKDMTVESLESEFRKKTGLGVQVFRKSGNLWIETSLTNDWTLEQQNTEGELLSSSR